MAAAAWRSSAIQGLISKCRASGDVDDDGETKARLKDDEIVRVLNSVRIIAAFWAATAILSNR